MKFPSCGFRPLWTFGVVFVAFGLMGADSASGLVPVSVQCPEQYHPPTLYQRPTSSELADLIEQGKLKGTTVEGRAVIRNGRPFCNFGPRYTEEPLSWMNNLCTVDPNDGRKFLCQFDAKGLSPGDSPFRH
jgi:hypothetical protein